MYLIKTKYTETMGSRKRWLPRIALVLLLTLIGGILFLELGSRWYFDGVPETVSLPPAAVCDPAIYPPVPEKLAALESILEVRRQGRRITPDELEGVLVAAPQADLPYLNGVFCNGMVYISQRLSPSARRYVARHELEHYFQFQGLDGGCQDWELCAQLGSSPGISLGPSHHHNFLTGRSFPPFPLVLGFPV